MVDVILVDTNDTQIGVKEKIAAHRDADLHRAFSILLFNSVGEILITKRASTKYHCGGLWTNACCSHPFPSEDTSVGAKRRLFEELGYTDVDLAHQFSFIYHAEFDNGLTEHEYDHVFVGRTDLNPPSVNPEELDEYKWVSVDELMKDMSLHPDTYTEWFKDILNRL